MNGDLEIRRFDVYDDGEVLNVTLEIHNKSARTLYAYREVRGIRYDAATNTVLLLLTDREFDLGFPTFVVPQPALVPIAPGESEILRLKVPRITTQMGPEQPERPGPTLRQSMLHQAAAVEARISWSDVPFYREPGEQRSHREQLLRWERGVVEVRMDRRSGRIEPPGSEPPRRA